MAAGPPGTDMDRGAYYSEMDKYTKDEVEADEKEQKELEERQKEQHYQRQADSWKGNQGYEFRSGHKVRFPEIPVLEGETEQTAAYRVAGELKALGVEAFKIGSVWETQRAADFWGQASLCLERLRNLRKYARKDNATDAAKESDVVALTDDEIDALWSNIRLNLAQGLLNLRDFEKCVHCVDVVLDQMPNCSKALWRKAKACSEMNNPGLAKESLQRLLEIDEGNAAAISLLKEIDFEEERKRAKRLGLPMPQRPRRQEIRQPRDTPNLPTPHKAVPNHRPPAKEEATSSLDVASRSWFDACCRRKRKPD